MLRTLSAKNAAALDKDLMGTGAFSLDQLMELAGLSISQAVYRMHLPDHGREILIACGPGNNGGDGLVAARHLVCSCSSVAQKEADLLRYQYGFKPTVYYPKQGKHELYQRLSTQLKSLDIPFTDNFGDALHNTDFVVDSIFGFSFSGEIREPFPSVIQALEQTKKPVLSVDAPSSWDIESGPPSSGPGHKFHPAGLISLTAPKPLVKYFRGRHFVGGRFVSPQIAKRYNIDIPDYVGLDQVCEIDSAGHRL